MPAGFRVQTRSSQPLTDSPIVGTVTEFPVNVPEQGILYFFSAPFSVDL
jgi:hypothetical protein